MQEHVLLQPSFVRTCSLRLKLLVVDSWLGLPREHSPQKLETAIHQCAFKYRWIRPVEVGYYDCTYMSGCDWHGGHSDQRVSLQAEGCNKDNHMQDNVLSTSELLFCCDTVGQ
jgi:hypothetical protein